MSILTSSTLLKIVAVVVLCEAADGAGVDAAGTCPYEHGTKSATAIIAATEAVILSERILRGANLYIRRRPSLVSVKQFGEEVAYERPT
jgi:hypothetical protein